MQNVTTLNTSNYIRKPRKSDPSRVERYYELTCGCCGSTYHLRMNDARKAVSENRPCGVCQRAAARQVAVDLYGEDFLINHTIAAQLANPSKPEQQIAKWLDELGVKYQRQVVIDLGSCKYIVDFLLDGGKAIEGAGGYWHALNKQAKDELLAKAMIVLFLTDDLVMKSPAEAHELVKRFVEC